MFKRLLSLAASAVMISTASAVDETNTAILARADMPNSLFPQAEVRLVRREAEIVVQSAILSRFSRRVLKKIMLSEQENWPETPDSKIYLATLQEAIEIYREKHDAGTTALVIDFVAGNDNTRIDFYFAPADRKKTGIIIEPAPVWKTLTLTDEYTRKNQEYILLDAFGDEAASHIKTLQTFLEALHEE